MLTSGLDAAEEHALRSALRHVAGPLGALVATRERNRW